MMPAKSSKQQEAKTLTVLDARPVIEMLRPAVLQQPGLTEALRLCAERDAGPVGQIAQSIFDALTHGASWREAIGGARPALPRNVQELLILGGESSALDRVLGDMLKAYQAGGPEQEMKLRMDRTLDEWQRRPAGALICVGCLERVLGKILGRAKLEEAGEVILEQDGEQFFHQWYIGAMPVHVIEPSHSLSYQTILKAFSDAAAAAQPLKPWNLKVRQESSRRFRLSGEGVNLKILFR